MEIKILFNNLSPMMVGFFAVGLGSIPAFIARTKGKDFFTWWIYGSVTFIVALIHSLIMKSK